MTSDWPSTAACQVCDLNAVELALNRINGVRLRFVQPDAINLMLAVAAGGKTEEQVADWIRQRIVS